MLFFCCCVAIAKLFYVEKYSEFPLPANLNMKALQLLENGLLSSSSGLFAMSPKFELVVIEVEVPLVVRLGLESDSGTGPTIGHFPTRGNLLCFLAAGNNSGWAMLAMIAVGLRDEG